MSFEVLFWGRKTVQREKSTVRHFESLGTASPRVYSWGGCGSAAEQGGAGAGSGCSGDPQPPRSAGVRGELAVNGEAAGDRVYECGVM